MAPLAVDTAALDSAGAEVVTAGEGLGSVISTLTAALSGCAGMAGDDPAGAALGRSYDSSAAKLVQAMVVTRNGLCGLGVGVRMSAHNYSLAEAQSDISGHGSPLPAPRPTGPISAGSPPSSVGTGDGPPAGWGWVAPFIGMIWPSADSGKLRAAAAAWSAAGTQFAVAEILGTGGPMGAIRGQQIPEGPAIDRAFTEAYSSTTGIVQQSQKIAGQLSDYAAKVDQVHAAILDLLARICDPMTGIKEVWDILTDEDEDEIKKIADDIRTVVDRFTAEVDALRAEIAATVGEAETILTTMGDYASREWDQFLHGTDVGRAINQVGQYAKGVYSEAGDTLTGLYDVSQVRLVLDPLGYVKNMGEMAEGAAPLVGLGPDGGPGVAQSWKQLGKDLLHWDEWDQNPASAAGRSALDLAMLALPGGPLSKLSKFGRGALGRLRPPEIPHPPSVKPPTPPPVEPPRTGPKPPEPGPKPPEPGRPAPAPPGTPTPAPPGAPAPHGPTESRPPVEPPHGGEPPKPTAPPHESGTQVSAPAEGKPPPHPQPHDRVPAAVSAPAAGAPGESVPSASVASASAPAASAPSVPGPHLSSPSSAGTAGAAGEGPPPFGGPPHGGEPGATPGGAEPGGHPRGGTPGGGEPPGSGDGKGPHGTGDGTPDGSGDGNGPHGSGDGTPDGSGDGEGSPGDHGHHDGNHEPPTAREVFPGAKEYGDLTEDQYREQFEDENGGLRYPDSDDPAKPYAIPGTAHDLTDAEIHALDGKKLDRIGHPGGEWLAPAGTPYEGRSLPHTSLDKPYSVYTVHAEVGLPPGWKIELSRAAPWFGHPGGEPQYFLIPPKDAEASVQELLDTGFLTDDEFEPPGARK